MKVAGLEETDTASLAQVAEQIEFLFREEAAIVVVECFEILDELAFALV